AVGVAAGSRGEQVAGPALRVVAPRVPGVPVPASGRPDGRAVLPPLEGGGDLLEPVPGRAGDTAAPGRIGHGAARRATRPGARVEKPGRRGGRGRSGCWGRGWTRAGRVPRRRSDRRRRRNGGGRRRMAVGRGGRGDRGVRAGPWIGDRVLPDEAV